MTDMNTEMLLHAAREDQDTRWATGECPKVESYLQRTPQLAHSEEDVLVLIYGEIMNRTRRGETIHEYDYGRRFPHLTERIRPLLEVHELLENDVFAGPISEAEGGANPSLFHVPGYRSLQFIARGGMSTIFQAVAEATEEMVAIKCLASERMEDHQALVRFLQEGELLAKFAHPNVLRLIETGVQHGHPYLVTEWVDDGTLAERLKDKPLAIEEVRLLIGTIARTLDEVHLQGIVHRDLKPANILITKNGVVKLADFGIARRLLAGGGCTATGQIIGTMRYMPPEQIQGHYWRIGPATDVYAVGAILYELLTGTPPFVENKPLELIPKILSEQPLDPRTFNSSIPNCLANICLACLEKEIENRPTCRQLAKRLENLENE